MYTLADKQDECGRHAGSKAKASSRYVCSQHDSFTANHVVDEESDSDDSDEAPEEISFGVGKQHALDDDKLKKELIDRCV